MNFSKTEVSKKFILRVLILNLFILILFTSVIQASILVDPSRYIINVKPGARVTEKVQVTNQTERALHLYANFYDWNLDENFELVTHELGTLPSSLDGYFRFNPRRFTLQPGESQTVRFTIDIPEQEMERERRGIIFFEQEQEIEEEGGATVISRIGTTVYVVPTGLEFSLNLLDMKVLRNEEGQILIAYLTENDSNRHLRFYLKYSLISSDGRLLEDNRIEETVLLPGMRRSLSHSLQTQLEPGEYQLAAEFSFPNTDEKLTQTISFRVR
jgi:hypothetical protein